MNRSVWVSLLTCGLAGFLAIGGITACTSDMAGLTVATLSPSPSPLSTLSPRETSTPARTPDRKLTETPVDQTQVTGSPTKDNVTAASQLRTFQIDSEKSEVRFVIDEELLGIPKSVIGRTKEISGAVTIDLADRQEPHLSPIWVDARDLKTDDSFRNRALRRQILLSAQDEYQFIVFEPTALADLPAVAEIRVGEPFSFHISGNLIITGISNPITFMMTATPTSQSELSASGQTTVLRSDYDLNIPSVPGVANVSDEVQLAVDFVAVTRE
jgi:polyisoprenoid-binding protein YceI